MMSTSEKVSFYIQETKPIVVQAIVLICIILMNIMFDSLQVRIRIEKNTEFNHSIYAMKFQLTYTYQCFFGLI